MFLFGESYAPLQADEFASVALPEEVLEQIEEQADSYALGRVTEDRDEINRVIEEELHSRPQPWPRLRMPLGKRKELRKLEGVNGADGSRGSSAPKSPVALPPLQPGSVRVGQQP